MKMLLFPQTIRAIPCCKHQRINCLSLDCLFRALNVPRSQLHSPLWKLILFCICFWSVLLSMMRGYQIVQDREHNSSRKLSRSLDAADRTLRR